MNTAVLIFISAAAFFFLCRPRKVQAQEGDRPASPLMASFPVPVLQVDSRSLCILSANAACTRKLEFSYRPGIPLDKMFTGQGEVKGFIRSACRNHIPVLEPGKAYGKEVLEELLCTWKGLQGSPARVMVTLFYIEKAPHADPVLYVSVDPNASVSAESLRRCFDAIPEILFFKDKDRRFMLCNSSFSAISGLSLEEVVGRSVPELHLAKPLDSLLCAHDDDVLESGLPFFSEVTVTVDDGSSLSFENHRYPDIGPDGTTQGIFGMCRDITLSKATAAALRRQGDLLQAANNAALMLFSDDEELDDLARRVLAIIGMLTGGDRAEIWRNHGSSDEGLLCTQVYTWTRDDESPTYQSSYANTALYGAHLPGWEEELSSGRSINTLTRELSPQELDHMRQQHMGAGLVVPILFRSTFWGFICLSVQGNEHDWGRAEEATLRSVGLLLAATMQRRSILEALGESEQRFRDVTMAAGEIIWELDAQGYFSYISERVFALTGYLPEEVRGMRWEDFAIDEAGEEATGRMFQASVPTGSFRAFEHRIRGKSGAPIWLFTSGKLLTGPDGIAGLRGTSLDVSHDKQNAENLKTTLKALENANRELELSAERAHTLARKAESASRAKSEFLANMSHEIRTPLNAIIGLAYLVKKTGLSRKQQDYVDKIHNAGVTLLGVVNDVLDFSKIESGKLAMEHLPFLLTDIFENLVSIVGEKAERQGLDMGVLVERSVPVRLLGDPLRLGQIFINLVGNAVKFTEKGGISIHCRMDGREGATAYLRISIRDTGIGIPEDRQDVLFQSFSQVDSSITRKYGGSGLGLVITKNLLELAGGTLSLESSSGNGTTITVRIPLEIDPAAQGDMADAGSLEGLRVIVIDPSDMQRALVLSMLQDLGCESAGYSELDAGFAALGSAGTRRCRQQVLILPLELLEGEGKEYIQRLQRENGTRPRTGVIAIAPYGYGGCAEEPASGEIPLPRVAFVCRPVLSFHIRECLRLLTRSGTMSGNCEEGRAPDVPLVPDLFGNRILLVEDNIINQQIAGELLADTGAQVEVADNGRVAVEMLQAKGPSGYDLVFMDLQMPEMDGFTATSAIRNRLGMKDLPVIAMTAHATVDERMRCLEIGMNEHIPKPIDVNTLYETLGRWLQGKRRNPEEHACARPLDDSPLPELPALDVSQALARRHGDVRSYKAALLGFYLQYAGAEKRLLAELEAGEIYKAMETAESVRQGAAGIGAHRLMSVCLALSEALAASLRKKSPAPDASEQSVRSFLAELPATVGMLELIFPLPPSSPLQACSAEESRHILQAELGSLNSLLSARLAAARAVFKQIKPLIRNVDVTAADAADKALALSDYLSALSVLEPLERSLVID